jgi:hypothetical protein
MSDSLSDPRYPAAGAQQPTTVRYDMPEPLSFEDAVTKARAALRGERAWDGWLTAPAVVAEACGQEFRDLRTLLDQFLKAGDQ